MMTFFNEPHTIKRCIGGGMPDGYGAFEPFHYEIKEAVPLNIQPAKKNDLDKLRLETNGRDFERAIIVFSEAPLVVAGESEKDGDWVFYDNDWYLIIKRENHINTYFPISHYKQYAVKNNVSDLQDDEGAGL